MALGIAFDTAYHSGTAAVTSTVPGIYPVALNGRAFMLDMALDATGLRGQYFRRQTIALLRDQADQGNQPGEQSISPDDLWRRSAEDWSHGAGQNYFDRKDSDPARFRDSRNVDVWTKWQAKLLPLSSSFISNNSAYSNVSAFTAGSYLYFVLGGSLYWSLDATFSTPVTGTPNSPTLAQTTDGYTVYLSYAAGLYTTTRGSTTATAYGSFAFAPTLLGYNNGRIMAALGPSIYNITAPPGGAPGALFTQANSDFTWTSFSDNGAYIYATGFSGDKGIVYRIGISADGTTLTQPIVASNGLPDGEWPLSSLGYAGYIVLGTNKGVRVCQPGSDGSLTIGGLIPTANPVLCLSGTGRFVYFGLTNPDTLCTGIGRMDLSYFTSPLTPAYAADMTAGLPGGTAAAVQGTVSSIAQFLGYPVFTISADSAHFGGVYTGNATYTAASGYITSGKITYGLIDTKVAMFCQDKTLPLPANSSESVAISVDSAPAQGFGSNAITGTTGSTSPYPVGQLAGETFELTHTLTSSVNNPSPTLTRWTLRSLPTPDRTTEWVLPLVVASVTNPYNDADVSRDYAGDIDYLFGLANVKALVTLQVGRQSYRGFVDDVALVPVQQGEDLRSYEATCVVSFKQVIN